MIKPALTGFAVTFIILGVPAIAQVVKGQNSNAPVDVAADRIEVQDRSDRAIFSGNVQVKQEGLTLATQRLTVAYTKAGGQNPQIERLDASGGVLVNSPNQTARGDFAIYDLNRRLITMLGNVELTQGGNRVSGGRLLIDLESGRSVIDGNSVGGGGTTSTSGGRVTGRFTVPDRKQ
jgi:lipopolysaccharide export system protein LptA